MGGRTKGRRKERKQNVTKRGREGGGPQLRNETKHK